MKKFRKGFTLVELLIVVSIIGILGASMSLSAKDATPAAEKAKLISDFKLIRTAIVLYHYDSRDLGPTFTYFYNHSNDYLAGKIKDYKLEQEDSGAWKATYLGSLSAAAAAKFTESPDYGISPAGTGGYGASMRVY